MARVQIPFVVQDQQGNALDGTARVYQRGTTTNANVYAAETGGSPLSQPLTVVDGKILGWVNAGSYDVVATSGTLSWLRSWDVVPYTTQISVNTYTIATRPDPTLNSAALIFVSDATTGKLQISDGTSWSSVGDPTTVGAPNTQTANYTAALGDAGKVIEFNLGTALTFTLPLNATVAFPIGTVITIRRIGAGSVTLHPASGAIQRNKIDNAGTADRTIANQWSEASYIKRATNEWVLVGDLA